MPITTIKEIDRLEGLKNKIMAAGDGPPKLFQALNGRQPPVKRYTTSSDIMTIIGSSLGTGMGDSKSDALTGMIGAVGESIESGPYGQISLTVWFSNDRKDILGISGTLIAPVKGSDDPSDSSLHKTPTKMRKEDIVYNVMNNPELFRAILMDLKE
jgi:hypothetical protein